MNRGRQGNLGEDRQKGGRQIVRVSLEIHHPGQSTRIASSRPSGKFSQRQEVSICWDGEILGGKLAVLYQA